MYTKLLRNAMYTLGARIPRSGDRDVDSLVAWQLRPGRRSQKCLDFFWMEGYRGKSRGISQLWEGTVTSVTTALARLVDRQRAAVMSFLPVYHMAGWPSSSIGCDPLPLEFRRGCVFLSLWAFDVWKLSRKSKVSSDHFAVYLFEEGVYAETLEILSLSSLFVTHWCLLNISNQKIKNGKRYNSCKYLDCRLTKCESAYQALRGPFLIWKRKKFRAPSAVRRLAMTLRPRRLQHVNLL